MSRRSRGVGFGFPLPFLLRVFCLLPLLSTEPIPLLRLGPACPLSCLYLHSPKHPDGTAPTAIPPFFIFTLLPGPGSAPLASC